MRPKSDMETTSGADLQSPKGASPGNSVYSLHEAFVGESYYSSRKTPGGS